MSRIIEGLLYSESHEWVKVEGDLAVIGVSDFAQAEMGDITYVDLPSEGDEIQAGEEFGALESVKASSDLYSPVSGTVEGMGISNPIESQSQTRTFTYTFDGEKGTLTGKDHTGAESTLPFTYNKKDNTITASENMVDEETGLSLKVVLVFTEAK